MHHQKSEAEKNGTGLGIVSAVRKNCQSGTAHSLARQQILPICLDTADFFRWLEDFLPASPGTPARCHQVCSETRFALQGSCAKVLQESVLYQCWKVGWRTSAFDHLESLAMACFVSFPRRWRPPRFKPSACLDQAGERRERNRCLQPSTACRCHCCDADQGRAEGCSSQRKVCNRRYLLNHFPILALLCRLSSEPWLHAHGITVTHHSIGNTTT